MKNMKISAKLLTAFGILAAALVVMAVMSVSAQSKLNDAAETLGRSRREKLVAIATINTGTSDYRVAEATSILSTEPDKIAEAEKEAADTNALIDQNIAYLDRSLSNPKAIEAFRVFRQHWATYIAQSRATLQLSHANQNEQALASYRRSKPLFDRGNDDAAEMQRVQVKLMETEMDAASALYFWSRDVTIALSLAALALTIVLLISLIRGIATPLTAMTATMRRLGAGDLNAEVAVDPRRDEVGELAGSMVAFRDQLVAAERAKQEQTRLIVDSVGSGLDSLARGDLTARIDAELTGPFAKLKDDFNNAMQSVAGTLTAVNASAEGITNGASDIRQASDDLSRRTEQQAASLEETAAAMHEITTTVRDTAANATKVNGVVTETRRDAEQSGDVVRRAVEAMNGIERSSNEISDIIAVIDGIAFQTNLLALNAGVEAARAGDAGKGFAVVASEVRALAQRSADAAKDVKSKITASTEQVDAGVTLVAQAGEALSRITGRIGDISALVSDIASAAEQQATGLQQVNTAVSEMDGVTQQNAAMVEEATAAARSLAEETENMARQVSRFRLGDRPVQASASRREAAASPVHQLQSRAANAGARIAAGARANRGSAAVAVAQDDWSEF
ncbi:MULTISPECIES: methyl-accepting chemotaxis protein [unclassified Sphingomonas]|uniref:methyl-accepting chemotaxis protein n=1 Tax=unclassified Sphingomonas TaxID=196159 RepID=UPI001612EC6D|nr:MULTISPECIES: methyl-accepting chemotaxis protein [unclassified Sphingomonas]MBB3345658.1 methyl-accepting chemotaxis protein [Sphingomonas sp. BK069]MBB3474717.1 methyl-accepting chemotaxis protein [Sphingomonas sp. BK345]